MGFEDVNRIEQTLDMAQCLAFVDTVMNLRFHQNILFLNQVNNYKNMKKDLERSQCYIVGFSHPYAISYSVLKPCYLPKTTYEDVLPLVAEFPQDGGSYRSKSPFHLCCFSSCEILLFTACQRMRPISSAARARAWALAGWIRRSRVRIPQKAWMFVLVFLCCVVLCRQRPWDWPIIRPRSPAKCINWFRNFKSNSELEHKA
jgi:hypothetical protein